ncbi:MAG TPA: ComEC/Rec2 family competence protein [Candidatus Udaeobacter sp.]|nr:ComEC/Rec2 family competence protein [Candidatus Udaeobacter sp.]
MRLLNPPRQPFVGLALMAIMGIILAEILPLPPAALIPAAIVLTACILILARWPRLVGTYFVVAAGFFLLHKFATTNTEGQQLADKLGDRPRTVTAVGSVITEPKIGLSGFATFLLKLTSIEFEGTEQTAGAIWQVRWKGDPEFGDELRLFGAAEPIAAQRNPGEFNMRAYLARHDVRRMLFVRYSENGTLIHRGGGNPLLRAAQKSRSWMQNALGGGLENAPEVQTFLSGIVLGLRHQAPEDIEEPFQQTGTLHLFAVAGLHVGIVATLLWIAATLARLSRKTAAAIIIPLLFFYAAVTGLHVSSIRAATMASILVGGIFFERKVFLANSLAAAAFFILCWNTNELFSTGFQLSFAVVGAIVLFTKPFFRILQRRGAPDPFLPQTLLHGPRRWMHSSYEWVSGGASVSLAAWIGSLPLILWYFHLVTPISLLANLVVVPIAFLILAIALLSLLTTPLFPWIAVVFNNANWSLATLVIGIVNLFAQIPGGHFYVAPLSWNEESSARMTVLDLGAGAATYLRTAGTNWLFDCGSERTYGRVVREYLHWAGVNRLSGLFLTHGDSLHIGGAIELLEDFPHTQAFDNPAPDRSALHRRLSRSLLELKKHGLKHSSLTAGDEFCLAPAVSARVLFPPPGFAGTTADDQAFVVRLLVAPATFVLLMSDSGAATEKALLNDDLELQSDILIKGQHHSSASGSDAFLDAVRPKLIIATSQDFPEHERISEDWAEQVRARGIKLFRQDETGAVELKFSGREWTARAYLTGEVFRSVNR